MVVRGSRQRPSRWERFKYWLLHLEPPLELRASVQRLRHGHKHPILELIRMFIPYPTWYFPIPRPYSLRELIEDTKNHTGIVEEHFDRLIVAGYRACARWASRGSLYELHLADHYAMMGYETEYFFFRPDWKVGDIPDPRDHDPLRYAVIASIVEELHELVNWRLSLGLRRNRQHVYREKDGDPWPPFTPEDLPEWPSKVPPIDKELLKASVPPESLDAEGNLVLEENGTGPRFAKRNIVTNTGWLYTI